MAVILPLTVVLILLILFALYGNLKFPLIIMFSVLVTVPVGGLLALKLTGTNFSVSSGFGFVALMGVAVQTSVILYSFINKLRLEGKDIATATHEASLLRLRPIMMTALVACLGLLPAAMSTGIGSDSQKPFAIVIVGGLVSRLVLSIFLAPVLYALVAQRRRRAEGLSLQRMQCRNCGAEIADKALICYSAARRRPRRSIKPAPLPRADRAPGWCRR